jgi:hypothetical protein
VIPSTTCASADSGIPGHNGSETPQPAGDPQQQQLSKGLRQAPNAENCDRPCIRRNDALPPTMPQPLISSLRTSPRRSPLVDVRWIFSSSTRRIRR